MLLVGFWLRWPNVTYDGPPEQQAYNLYAFDRFSYSDIASLFYRDDLRAHPRPYFDYPLEYPVGMGLVIYLLNGADPTRSMAGYFLLTSCCMAICGLAIAWLAPCFPRGRVWLLALSPALAFYVNLNWDMWGVLLMMVALLLFERERDAVAGAALAAAVWTKFFPILLLPLLLVERARAGNWRAVGRLAGVFTLVSVAINAPLLILRPRAWLYFFETNRTRGREVNLWNFFDGWGFSTEQINAGSAVLLAVGLVMLMLVQWRGISGAWLPACCAILAWFFFVNKVYSPQYSLWIVVLLAAIGAAPALAVAWSAVDLLYFAASFLILGLEQFGDPVGWFYIHGLFPAMALREGMLLIVAGWCMRRLHHKDTRGTTF